MAEKTPRLRPPKPGEPVRDLLGKSFRVSRQRGEIVASSLAPVVTATVHPSSILRASDDETRREEMRQFVADLKKVAAAASGAGE